MIPFINNKLSLYALLSVILGLPILGCTNNGPVNIQEKPRIVITTDPELDDSNSLIRFLLYSTDFRIEGLVYASSQFHWKGDGKGTLFFVPGREYTRSGLNYGPMESWRWAEGERFIDDAVEAYEKVYPNLKVHNPDYPTPEELKSKIRIGNIEFDGDISKDTPGSDLIKSLILDDVPGTLYLQAWGGASTISRALLSIQEEYENTSQWESIQKKVSGKVIVCLSGDQDNTYANYIKPNWPDIKSQQISGGVSLGYGAQSRAKAENVQYYSPEWTEKNVLSKGPLGSLYRIWGDGKQMVEGDIFDYFGFSEYTADELRDMGYVVWSQPMAKGSFISEGDTYCYLNFIDNGLRGYLDDEKYGGWGGRNRGASTELPGSFVGGSTSQMPADGQSQMPAGFDPSQMMSFSRQDTVMPDFVKACQNSMAARFAWSVEPNYSAVNHEPEIKGAMNVTANPGENVKIKYTVSDPDRDQLTVKWWQFKVGSYQGDVSVDDPSSASTSFTIPEDAKSGDTIHLILEAEDDGIPALTKYHRVVISVK